jgi:hypothetical protein
MDQSQQDSTSTQGAAGEPNVRQKIADRARNAAAKVKATTGDTMAKVKDEAAHLASDKREAAASRIGGYSSAMHDSARALEEKDPNVAWFAHQAADKLQQAAEYVRGRDLAGLRDDVAGIARRHPVAYFGGMFVAGLVLGNLVKASPRAAASQTEEPSFDENTGANYTEPNLGSSENNAPTMAEGT